MKMKKAASAKAQIYQFASFKQSSNDVPLQLLMTTFNQICILLHSAILATSLHFQYSVHLIPHPQKAAKGGQDAFFASQRLLVVADGVGGWNNKGVDPSLYSRFLCSAAQVYFNEDTYHFSRHPEDLIQKAADNNRHVVTIEGDRLRSCHIGGMDSLFRLQVARITAILRTVDQMHGFNFPYQLAQEQYGGDDPKQAICSSLAVREGDLVILASDGITDNIFSYQMVALAEQTHKQKNTKDLAKKLSKIAAERGKKRQGNSPFSLKAKEHGIKYQGGKLDDVTVIVAEIVSNKTRSNQITQL